jgi:tripartite-type tricarboxylate transporter receptor subunit TctC
MRLFRHLARLAAIALIASAASAQDGATRVILPFGPGSGTDNVARPLFDEVSRELNQSFVIDNRPGASGFIASEAVARAAPDGKTLLFTTNTTHAINPALFKKLPYDPVKDFKPVSLVVTSPYLLLVRKDFAAKDVNELIAWIKANPGTASYGWGAAVSQMAGAGFLKRLGLSAVGVPYTSSPQAVTDLIGGQLSFMFLDLAAATPVIAGDRVKALAITAPARLGTLPTIPTMAESGVKDFEVAAWIGLFAPAGVPDAQVQRLSAAIRKVMANPALQKKYENCCTPRVLAGDEFADFVKKDRALWAERAAAAGIVPE